MRQFEPKSWLLLLLTVLGFTLAACVARQPPQIVGVMHPPVNPKAVTLYYKPGHVPAHYQVLAKLDTRGLGGYSSSAMNRKILIALREQAGLMGANGLLLVQIGKGTVPWRFPSAGSGFKAYAIYVKPDKRDDGKH